MVKCTSNTRLHLTCSYCTPALTLTEEEQHSLRCSFKWVRITRSSVQGTLIFYIYIPNKFLQKATTSSVRVCREFRLIVGMIVVHGSTPGFTTSTTYYRQTNSIEQTLRDCYIQFFYLSFFYLIAPSRETSEFEWREPEKSDRALLGGHVLPNPKIRHSTYV